MSDTSDNSESSNDEHDTLRPFLSKHKRAQLADQQNSYDGSDSESDTDSSSDEEEEEDEDEDFVEQTAMSHKLGHVDIFGIKSEVCTVHGWLEGLADGSTHEQVTVDKQTIRHHKRILDEMRHRLKDAGSMADKVSHFMFALVRESITSHFDMATQKVIASESTRSAIMGELLATSMFRSDMLKVMEEEDLTESVVLRELLATNNFRSEMLERIEEEVLQHEGFPHGDMASLNAEISKSVNRHLKIVLLDKVKKQAETKVQKVDLVDKVGLETYTRLLNEMDQMK